MEFRRGCKGQQTQPLAVSRHVAGVRSSAARFVAPPGLDLPEDETAFDVYVLPRPTAPPGIFVLASQVAALIAYVRYELLELEQFEAHVLSGA